MKKVVSLSIVLIIILSMFGSNIYANEIVEIEKGKNIEIELDLSKIEGDKVYVFFKNNEKLKNVKINITELAEFIEEEGYKYIELDRANLLDNKFKFEVDLVENINVDEIVNIEIAISNNIDNIDKLQFKSNMYKIIKKDEGDKGENNNPNEQPSKGENNSDDKKEDKGETTIVEKGDTDNKQLSNSKKDTVNTGGIMSTGTSAEKATYKGSQDNYLLGLSVLNYEFNTEFNKTNNTYFLDVQNEISNISVNYEKSDSTQVVKIYGNNNLEIGVNKVLVSVTAENGDVRQYRIYVIKAE